MHLKTFFEDNPNPTGKTLVCLGTETKVTTEALENQSYISVSIFT